VSRGCARRPAAGPAAGSAVTRPGRGSRPGPGLAAAARCTCGPAAASLVPAATQAGLAARPRQSRPVHLRLGAPRRGDGVLGGSLRAMLGVGLAGPSSPGGSSRLTARAFRGGNGPSRTPGDGASRSLLGPGRPLTGPRRRSRVFRGGPSALTAAGRRRPGRTAPLRLRGRRGDGVLGGGVLGSAASGSGNGLGRGRGIRAPPSPPAVRREGRGRCGTAAARAPSPGSGAAAAACGAGARACCPGAADPGPAGLPRWWPGRRRAGRRRARRPRRAARFRQAARFRCGPARRIPVAGTVA
jgi:hypothetical protein